MTDEELISLTGDEDETAYRQLVRRHFDALFRFSARLTGDRMEAEDVLQDVFLKVWRQPQAFRGAHSENAVRAWLFRLVHNASIDRIRRRKVTVEPADAELIDQRPGPDRQLQTLEEGSIIEAEMAGLPERQRVALQLVHYSGLSGQEAAGILEVTVEALESLLARGRRTLRQRVAERLNDDEGNQS